MPHVKLRVAQFLVFCVVFCRSLFVHLYFFDALVHFLCFDLRFQVINDITGIFKLFLSYIVTIWLDYNEQTGETGRGIWKR